MCGITTTDGNALIIISINVMYIYDANDKLDILFTRNLCIASALYIQICLSKVGAFVNHVNVNADYTTGYIIIIRHGTKLYHVHVPRQMPERCPTVLRTPTATPLHVAVGGQCAPAPADRSPLIVHARFH